MLSESSWLIADIEDEYHGSQVIHTQPSLNHQCDTECTHNVDGNPSGANIKQVLGIEAIRLFLAYASYKDFMVYLMDVKSSFLYGKIEEEVYVCQPPGFEDLDFPDRVYKVEKALYGLHQAPRACTGLQVKQKEDGIFISQDKYVTEILKKFSFSDVKTTSTPMETHKPLLKYADGEDIDEHIFQVNPKVSHLHVMKRIFRYLKDRKSTTGGYQFLGCRLISWQCKKQTVVANYTTAAEYVAASSCCGQVLWIQNQLLDYGMVKNMDNVNKFLMYPRFVQMFVNQQAGDMSNHKKIYVIPSHTKKVFGNIKREGKGFSGRVTPLFPTMMVQAQQEQGKGSENPTDHTPTIVQPSSSQPQKKYKPRKPKKDTQIPQSSIPSDNIAEGAINEENVPTQSNDPLLSGDDRLKLKELMALCTNLQNRVLDLEHTKTTQALEINSLKRRVKKLEKNQRSRTHGLRRLYKVGLSARVISSEDEGLGEEDASKQGRKIHDIDVDEDITLENDMAEMEVNTTDPVTTAGEVVTTPNVKDSTASPTAATINTVELTLAQTLAELKSARPKTKGVVMQEPSKTTTTTIPLKDKGKGWKPKDLKTKSFTNVQELFDKAMKRVNTFVDMNTELVGGSEVREEGGETREESSSKRAVIPDEEEVAVDVIPLATKPPSIVNWKIIKEGKIGYYQIIRANGNSKRYSSMIQMLKSFDREDLETLWKLVKAKHGYTRPEERYERVSLEHFVRFQDMHIFMLVEKSYPLTPTTITEMLNRKLQADHCNEMWSIIGIKSLLEVTAVKLVLLVQKLLLLVLKVNAAGIKVTTAERLQLLKG
ncbi:retrovirus-related pol polyprotein from transposon TNT 1-94 [Tanacetum coccineum]